MASIRTETIIDAPIEAVWDALRDWDAPHERLVRGFVVDTRLDGAELPDELADNTRAMMEQGTAAVKETLEAP